MTSSRAAVAAAAATARVLAYPHNLLRTACETVANVAAPEVRAIAADLVAVLAGSPALGVSAPQVGHTARVFAMRRPRAALAPRPTVAGRRRALAAASARDESGGALVVINPVILRHSVRRELQTEGCLSFPDEGEALVWRWAAVDVQFMNGAGEVVFERFQGLPAAVFQHEADHLDGVLLPDRELLSVPVELGTASLEELAIEASARGRRELAMFYGTAWLKAFE